MNTDKIQEEIEKIHKEFNKAYQHLNELLKLFVFKGFYGSPIIILNNDMDFILQYDGHYLPVSEALQIMKEGGYIIPDEFYSKEFL